MAANNPQYQQLIELYKNGFMSREEFEQRKVQLFQQLGVPTAGGAAQTRPASLLRSQSVRAQSMISPDSTSSGMLRVPMDPGSPQSNSPLRPGPTLQAPSSTPMRTPQASAPIVAQPTNPEEVKADMQRCPKWILNKLQQERQLRKDAEAQLSDREAELQTRVAGLDRQYSEQREKLLADLQGERQRAQMEKSQLMSEINTLKAQAGSGGGEAKIVELKQMMLKKHQDLLRKHEQLKKFKELQVKADAQVKGMLSKKNAEIQHKEHQIIKLREELEGHARRSQQIEKLTEDMRKLSEKGRQMELLKQEIARLKAELAAAHRNSPAPVRAADSPMQERRPAPLSPAFLAAAKAPSAGVGTGAGADAGASCSLDQVISALQSAADEIEASNDISGQVVELVPLSFNTIELIQEALVELGDIELARTRRMQLEEAKKQKASSIREPATILNRKYHLGNPIGRGALSCVHRALDLVTGHFVAIKSVDSTHQEALTFLDHEHTLLSKLQHPNIVRCLESIDANNHFYVAFEYVEGGSLSAVVRKFGGVKEPLAASYIRQLLCALEYLHGQNIVHKDIKCSNLLVTKDGRVKLCDFGISLDLASKAPPHWKDQKHAHGSPYWMAPEVIEMKPAVLKSDIWSLGCTLIEMVTGFPPYAELSPMQAVYAHMENPTPPIPDDVSLPLQQFLCRCLIRDPQDRSTAKELSMQPFVKLTPAQLASAPIAAAAKVTPFDLEVKRALEVSEWLDQAIQYGNVRQADLVHEHLLHVKADLEARHRDRRDDMFDALATINAKIAEYHEEKKPGGLLEQGASDNYAQLPRLKQAGHGDKDKGVEVTGFVAETVTYSETDSEEYESGEDEGSEE
mmetsp:Transcript_52602/g.132284  ORF Transcript_52602/g.132284 Transcript_52602/m.132284 type:complete len:857 (-) Transcript_52602:20-2590(-)